MDNNTVLHLFVAPKGAVINDNTMSYLEAHCSQYYPKSLQATSNLFKAWVRDMVSNAPKGAYKYSLKHYTTIDTGRYNLEEQFEVNNNRDGLFVNIGPSSLEEREVISTASKHENEIRSIDGVITYLEDIYANDNLSYMGKCIDGVSNLDLLKGLIDLLTSIRYNVGVLKFELNTNENGIHHEMVLVCPKVVGYYMGITWDIK